MFRKQPRLTSCETCPYRMPMDEETWEKVRQAQMEATPEYSDANNEHTTAVEREMFAGIEAHVDECPGYSMRKTLVGMAVDALAGYGRLITAQNGGTRFVKAAERHCNNPFLETPEYVQLAGQLTRKAAEEFEAGQAQS